MRTSLKMLLVVGVAALLAVPAVAQPPRGGGFGRGGAGGGVAALLTNKSVQDELKMTADQVDKVRTAVTGVREKHTDDFSKLKELKGEERTAKSTELTKTVSAETLKAVGDILKPDQLKRLNQIALQQKGVEGIIDNAKELKLTDDQKKKLTTIKDDTAKEVADLMQNARAGGGGGGAGFQEAMTKVADKRKEATKNATAVLTADQAKTWKGLTGDTFEVKFEGRQGGKPGGGGKGEKKPTT